MQTNEITVSMIKDIKEMEEAYAIRREVFMVEGGEPEEEQFDGNDFCVQTLCQGEADLCFAACRCTGEKPTVGYCFEHILGQGGWGQYRTRHVTVRWPNWVTGSSVPLRPGSALLPQG